MWNRKMCSSKMGLIKLLILDFREKQISTEVVKLRKFVELLTIWLLNCFSINNILRNVIYGVLESYSMKWSLALDHGHQDILRLTSRVFSIFLFRFPMKPQSGKIRRTFFWDHWRFLKSREFHGKNSLNIPLLPKNRLVIWSKAFLWMKNLKTLWNVCKSLHEENSWIWENYSVEMTRRNNKKHQPRWIKNSSIRW